MERRKRLQDYWNDSLQDVRYTFRTLGRDPSFAAISILILALAIGANIAVFQCGQHAAPASAAISRFAPASVDRPAADRLRPFVRHLLRRRIRGIPRPEPRLPGCDRIHGLLHA